MTERPFVFQKFSFHGLVLVKEILSKARDEVNQMCLEDLSNEINIKQAKIDEFTKVNGKTPKKIEYRMDQIQKD